LYAPREQWRLVHAEGEIVSVPVNYALQTNSLAYVHRSLRAGLGIGPQVQYSQHQQLSLGDLVPVLPEWRLGNFELNIVYPSREYLPKRIRAVIDFFIDERDAIASACR
jgi:DNA-binding transcriptional LysR family regulator